MLPNSKTALTVLEFLDALRHRVGGKIALSNMAGDLQISPKTAKPWLEVLERMYLVFPVYPFTRSLPRAVLNTRCDQAAVLAPSFSPYAICILSPRRSTAWRRAVLMGISFVPKTGLRPEIRVP